MHAADHLGHPGGARAHAGDAILSIRYRATVDCDYDLLAKDTLHATPIAQLDSDAIQFLFPSRYCQSDRLSRLAWDLFGKIKHP